MGDFHGFSGDPALRCYQTWLLNNGKSLKSSVTWGYHGIIWDNMFLQSKIAIENPRTQWMCVFLGEKHRTMAGRFSSTPCLMTGRYTAANQKIKNEKWFSSNIPAQSEVLHPFNNFFDFFEKSWKFAVPTLAGPCGCRAARGEWPNNEEGRPK